MKKITAQLISGLLFAGLFTGVALADDDDHYEYGERYEHGRYYSPYGYSNNTGYRNHERYEYGNDDYRYRGAVRNSYTNPYANNVYSDNSYYNSNYRNHELYEYRR